MKESTQRFIDKLVDTFPELKENYRGIQEAIEAVIECYQSGGKLLVCGNGGSAADSEHIVGELMKGFLLPRVLKEEDTKALTSLFPEDAEYLVSHLQQGLPAISLVSQTALMTAFANDISADLCFAQQVLGYGVKGDILIAISTSGDSKNVIYATEIAKLKEMKVIALTGYKGGKLKDFADILLNVPTNETYRIQEYHLPIYHALCAAIENEFFVG